MAKKLCVVWLAITMVTFSSISIYATEQPQGDFFIPRAPIESPLDEEDSNLMEKENSRTEAELALTAAAAVEAVATQKAERYLNGLAAYIRSINSSVSKEDAQTMATNFVKYAEKYNVDDKVIMAMAQTESCFKSDAVSSENFKGLMQTGDGLARNAGYSPTDLFDPAVSIKVGARYLSIKMKEFGDITLALTAYNQGSGSVNSGNYSTGYAQLTLSRAGDIENFLKEHGYTE